MKKSNKSLTWTVRLIATCMVGLAISSCASHTNSVDPLVDFNRKIYIFNRSLDKAVLRPIARKYQEITPKLLNTGISNIFSNLKTPISAVNALLQLKIEQALIESARFTLNSVIGLAGFFDVASDLDLNAQDEDFGQTLGVWGSESSTYLMLPFIGPTTVRDGIGSVADYFFSPITYLESDEIRAALSATNLVDERAGFLVVDQLLEESFDEYVFVRDAYLQRRRSLINDGAETDDVFSEFDEEYEEYEEYEEEE